MPELRQRLVDTVRRMTAHGLNKGTSGNLSVRVEENGISGYLITPTGMSYDTLSSSDIVFMALHDVFGETPANGRKPSSEWRFHRDIYARRPGAHAVLHAHSPFATALACLRWDIPPFHYMIARFGGDSVLCAKYATFGTQALSDAALEALKNRTACLLANHGQLVFGQSPEHALALGVELETLCEQYWRACQLGEPVLLGAEEMRTILEKFSYYGQQSD